MKDIQFALRSMWKQPGYTAVIALSLGLGIGANTAIFTLINAVFLHPLPVRNISELVTVFTSDPRNPGFLPFSVPNYRDLRDRNTVFAASAGYTQAGIALATDAQPEQIFGELTSGNFFDLLGTKPALGRTYSADEDAAPGAHPVVVLSDAFWKRQYGANSQILGQTLKLNGHPFQVIGVAPPNFTGINALRSPALWAPLAMYAQLLPFKDFFESRRFLMLSVIGRLKPGTSIEQAGAQLKTIALRLQNEYPADNRERGVKLLPLSDSIINPNGRDNIVGAGRLLMAVVALVLLIACANVANLQMVRAAGRRKEIAIRLSMGASRFRLTRQFITESLLLALAGGLVGLVIAAWGRNLLWSFRPPFLRANDLNLAIDGNVLLFTFGIALLTGVLFGLAPALQSASPNVVAELKERTSQAARGGSWFTIRNLLVVGQVGLSLVALVGAGLFLRSLQNAQRIDVGFAAGKLALFETNLGTQGYTPERAILFYRQMLERLRPTPGVRSASLASLVPLGFGGISRSVFLEGQDPAPGNRGVLVLFNNIEPRYFETLEIPLLRGRAFTESDREQSTPVAIVNETMANKFWPNQDALGKRFRFFGDNDPVQVVGVVRDNKYFAVSEDPRACAFVPLAQKYSQQMALVFRGDSDPAGLLGTVRREVQGMDPNLLITNAFTMNDLIGQSLWASRMGAGLLALFGLLALLLSSIGVYGVMAHSVAQRTGELGIRMALGAPRADVFRLIVSQGLALVGAGIAAGLGAAFALSRFAERLLFGVHATDPATFAMAAAVLLAVALLALLGPARKATAIDPVVALRAE